MQRRVLALALATLLVFGVTDALRTPGAPRAPVRLGRSLRKSVSSYRKRAKRGIKRYGPQAVAIAGKLVTAATGAPVDRFTDAYKQSVDNRRAMRKAEKEERKAQAAYDRMYGGASLPARGAGSYVDGARGAGIPQPMKQGFVVSVGRFWNGLFGGHRG